MTFVVAHHDFGFSVERRSMRRAGRRLAHKVRGLRIPTPQERADRYVSRTPLAVLAPPTAGERR
ncbi:hypothetical protein [Mycobacterium conspicuum]|uniref:Uncharacterized protein n=1 Tax=Mycobacterium conspicuum TaxID=44010 RepID=A0A7I7YN60_9MYCO|nr:hypothetical protein [Mycobacterium conspicuum]BBZ42562.1 hypothetical protein MCNS_56250 [Mycobacterium conspicuum]